MVLWAISLHRNEVTFKGTTASIDGVVHDVKGFVSVLHRRGGGGGVEWLGWEGSRCSLLHWYCTKEFKL